MKKKLLIDVSYLGYLTVSNSYMWDLKKDYIKELSAEDAKKEKDKIIFEKLSDKNVQKDILSHMFNKLNSVIRDFKFEKEDVIVCFDSEELYWREKLYSEYKKNRELTYEKTITRKLLESFYDVLKLSNFKIIKEKGVEADEIIYFLCKELEKKETTPVVFSIDGDMPQIKLSVSSTEFISPRLSSYINYDLFEIKMGLLQKIIIGDRKDNIVGIKLQPNIEDKKIRNMRFGEKTISEKFKDIIKNSPDNIEGFNEVLEKIKTILIEDFSTFSKEDGENIGKNFELNQQLINLSFVPDKIEKLFLKGLNNQENLNIKLDKYEISIMLSQLLNDNTYKSVANLIEIPYLFNTNEIDVSKLKEMEYIIFKTNKKDLYFKPNDKLTLITKDDKTPNVRILPLEVKVGNNILLEYSIMERNQVVKKQEEFLVNDIIFNVPNIKEMLSEKINKLNKNYDKEAILNLNIELNKLNLFNSNGIVFSFVEKNIIDLKDVKDIILLDTAIEALTKIHLEKDIKTINFFEKYNPTNDLKVFEQLIKQIADKKIIELLSNKEKTIEQNIPKSNMLIESIK